MIETADEQYLRECIGMITPEGVSDDQLAYVIMCGDYPEQVVLGTVGEARKALTKFAGDEPAHCWLASAELVNRNEPEEKAIFGFAAWLTTRDEPVTISANHCAATVADLVKEYLEQVEHVPD